MYIHCNLWTLGLSCADRPLNGFREGSNQSAQAQCNLPGSLRGLFRPVLLLSGLNCRGRSTRRSNWIQRTITTALFVHLVRQEETIRIISARPATTEERKIYEHDRRLKKRFEKPRPMTSISIRMPEDVLDSLKEVSTALGSAVINPLSVSTSDSRFARTLPGSKAIRSQSWRTVSSSWCRGRCHRGGCC